jgi:hypothetical protein
MHLALYEFNTPTARTTSYARPTAINQRKASPVYPEDVFNHMHTLHAGLGQFLLSVRAQWLRVTFILDLP